jgi:hypothetical protein
MFNLTHLSDDDLRARLFDALVERFDAKAREDPSIAFVNRMPTVLAVSRGGNLLTLAQSLGPWLLRGDLKSRDRGERLRTFNVGRAAIQTRLVIAPDRVEGEPDEILDRIVTMFLEWTVAGEESQRAAAKPVHESRQTPLQEAQQRQSASRPPLQQSQPASRSAGQEGRPATSAGSMPKRRPATPQAIRKSRRTAAEGRRPASPEVIEESPPKLQIEHKPTSIQAVPPPPEPFQEVTPRTFRTYQLLFETARRGLDQAKSLPGDNKSFLLSAGVFVAMTAEAFFNDLGSRVIPSWSQLQRLDPREKAEVLNIELFNDKVDWSVRPFQSVAAALGFRRSLAHAHAETLSFDQVRGADRESSEVPRTRRTAWPEHCDVATIQRWITDVRLLIERFSRGHDPTEVAVGVMEQP